MHVKDDMKGSESSLFMSLSMAKIQREKVLPWLADNWEQRVI